MKKHISEIRTCCAIASQTRNDDEIWEMLNASRGNHPVKIYGYGKRVPRISGYLIIIELLCTEDVED